MRLLIATTALGIFFLSSCGKSEIAPEGVMAAPIATPGSTDAIDTGIVSGQELVFITGSPDVAALSSGWSGPEAQGTWSQQAEATITLNLSPTLKGKALSLQFVATAFTAPKVPIQIVNISIEGENLGQWEYKIDQEQGGNREILIPAELNDALEPLMLKFSLSNATAPSTLGISADIRQLGVHLRSMRINLSEPHGDSPITPQPTPSQSPT